MDFSLTEEQGMFRDLFSQFAENEVAPLAEELDRAERPPVETLKQAAAMELLGLPISEEYDGAGLDALSHCLFLEELGKACLSTALTVAAHNGGCFPVALAGTEAQKRKHLAPAARGELPLATALWESSSGDDLKTMWTKAQRDGAVYRLTGEKEWVVNGGIAEAFIVFARTEGGIAAFVVEKETPGLKIGKALRTMGVRGLSITPLYLDDCPIPTKSRLGDDTSDGAELLEGTLEFLRLSFGAACLGLAAGALSQAVDFAVTREQFGAPIARKGAIQAYVAEMEAEVEALRHLVYRTAWAADQGDKYSRLAAICQLQGAEVAGRVADKAVQVHGGSGYVRDYPIERLYRDARAVRLLPDRSASEKHLIAADVFAERGLEVPPGV